MRQLPVDYKVPIVTLEKMSIKADILSRKNQVDTTEDNKDVKLLKDELWI